MNYLKWAFAVLTLAVFAAAPESALAQEIRLGVKGGVNIADVGGDIGEELESRTTFAVGGVGSIAVAPGFAIQPEVLYTQKGGHDEEDDLDVKLAYIQVPVLATYTIPIEESRIAPRLFAGPAVAFKLSCDLSNGGEVDCDDALEEEGLEVKSVDFGVVFGGGVDVAVGRGAATAEVRYDLSLTDLTDTITDGLEAADGGNRVIQFLVGYMIPVGGL